VSKNWNISASFPSEAVVAAYTNPQVDKSTDPFTWGRPDLESLRKFCNERFSWAKDKADELLLPVLKEYDRRETQLRLEAFYSFNQRFAKVRSTRIQKALRGTSGQLSEELTHIPLSQDDSPPVKKLRKKSKESDLTANISEVTVDEEIDPMIGKGISANASRGRGRTSKGSNKASISAFDKVPEERKGEQSVHLEDTASGQVRGRGSDRAKRRGRGRVRGRGRGIKKGVSQSKHSVQNESSSSQSGSDGASEEILEKPGLLKRKVVKPLPEPRRVSYLFKPLDKLTVFSYCVKFLLQIHNCNIFSLFPGTKVLQGLILFCFLRGIVGLLL
jgi:DNA excision repair protein ERCC-5